jgi:radical S-adenosyl methionine domain-containing protein 2
MKTFETASFHIVKPCNMACKFCYATFGDMEVRQISFADVQVILWRLKDAGVEKITFAGGEPMLYRHLTETIRFAKEIGFTTSIITNGSFLTYYWLKKHTGILDWIGISIDSLNSTTNKDIGRIIGGGLSPNRTFYRETVDRISSLGYRLKINTVVNRFNENESLQEFIDYANPARWKIFDTLRVEGQNDKQFDGIRSSPGAFEAFVARHNHPSMVVENNEAMTGSYLLIDPQGRLFENSAGRHTYSSPLQHNPIEKCLSEINLNREMFEKRGGIYNW